MRKSFRGGLAILASASLVSGITACQGDDTSKKASADSSASQRPLAEFVDLFRGQHFSYSPAEGPEALAEVSDLVVKGRITDVIPGRTYNRGLSSAVTLVVSVDDEFTEAEAPDTVYVEMQISGGVPAEAVRTYLPQDLQAVFYLVYAFTAAEAGVDDETAGRPAGQPLYMPYDPDSVFVAESQSGERTDGALDSADGGPERVTQLLDDQLYVEADISEFLPPSTSWPAEYVHQGEGD